MKQRSVAQRGLRVTNADKRSATQTSTNATNRHSCPGAHCRIGDGFGDRRAPGTASPRASSRHRCGDVRPQSSGSAIHNGNVSAAMSTVISRGATGRDERASARCTRARAQWQRSDARRSRRAMADSCSGIGTFKRSVGPPASATRLPSRMRQRAFVVGQSAAAWRRPATWLAPYGEPPARVVDECGFRVRQSDDIHAVMEQRQHHRQQRRLLAAVHGLSGSEDTAPACRPARR